MQLCTNAKTVINLFLKYLVTCNNEIGSAVSKVSFFILCSFYGVVVVDTTGIDFQNSQPDQATFNDAEAYDATDPEQTYYITAAWDDASRVPEYFIVGNGSTTVVQLVTYLNARLAFNRGYAIFYQVRIQSDTDEVNLECCCDLQAVPYVYLTLYVFHTQELVVNSDYVIVRTAEEGMYNIGVKLVC